MTSLQRQLRRAMTPWMDMAYDAGARGDEQRQMAAQIEQEERDMQEEREDAARALEELDEKIRSLPRRIGLCPEHAPEFYYPLDAHGGDVRKNREDLICPSCSLTMIVYAQEESR